jgi:hypothetical protein
VDLDAMDQNVVRFDLDRPTLEVLREAAHAVSSWIRADSNNVAVLTCCNGIKTSCLVAACVYAEITCGVNCREGVVRFFERR